MNPSTNCARDRLEHGCVKLAEVRHARPGQHHACSCVTPANPEHGRRGDELRGFSRGRETSSGASVGEERRATGLQQGKRDEQRGFSRGRKTSDGASAREERRATGLQQGKRDERRGFSRGRETSDGASAGEERPAMGLQQGKRDERRGFSRGRETSDEASDPKDTPPPTRVETREERLERRRRERAEQVAYKLEQEIAVWDPHSLPLATADPFKTLFVARINFDTSESKLRREFEVYGPIKKVFHYSPPPPQAGGYPFALALAPIVTTGGCGYFYHRSHYGCAKPTFSIQSKIVVTHNTVNGKPRGYAFIEYEHERDMHSAYKHADGKKIDGRRVLVDVERARTVKGWLPRRLENNIEVLTAVEWKQAAGIVEVLGPLSDATKEISGDSYPTSSMVIPIPLCLKSYLNVFITSKKDGVMFARNLDKALKIRFRFYDSDPIFCPSMLCDPRFRGVLIDDMVAVNTLAIEVKLSDKSSLEPNVKDEQPSCSSSSSGLWSSFDSIPNTTQPAIDNNSEGGGLGGTRRGGPDVNIKHSGREDNERERERYRLEREREAARGAPERNADRDRDRRRSRSRERERLEREKRRKSRSRSRERKRRRSRERVKEKDPDIEEIERVERPPPRDRDRDRDRKRRRSRSRDRGAERDRERGDRDRKRERRDRDRGGEKGEREKERRPRSEEKDVRIKLEPPDDYPDYSNTNYEENYEESNVKYEQGEENYNEASGEAEPNGRYEADY
uniref:U1 small nuclear ribonucleoprotein 70 kDa n=1 Tax=Timema poppense TaxID=170557 RepID=A0A7R9DA34_TIMPO|nr:unnamed protein product [Timema poppensis]